jgi:dCTP deaminase
MSVLCDWEIRSLCDSHQMIWPFTPELLNPASLDVRLGHKLMIEVSDRRSLITIDISDRTEEDPYLLTPGEFVLAETIETFNLPDDISAQFVLKSSRAREGFTHALAGWIDPGFNKSKLTLELKNQRRYHGLHLYPNLKIGQLVFFQMNSTPAISYAVTGRYNGHGSVMPSADEKAQ